MMLTFAAVDIGANSVRLKIARAMRHKLHVVHEDREVTRLGATVFQQGVLSPEAMAKTISVLQRFHRATQDFGADSIRVIGTSSLRDAANARTFIEWVKSTTGWKLEVISGAEEGRLIHLGVLAFERHARTRMLLVDLGGGSCEFTFSVNGHIRNLVSLPLGAVRLTGEFLKSDPSTPNEIARLRQFVQEEIRSIATVMRKEKVRFTIATSGTAAALLSAARTLSARGEALNTVSSAMTRRIADGLAGMGIVDRSAQYGIGAKRAEIIVAGATVFAEFLGAFQLPNFRYSSLGLRDGVLAAMMAEQDIRSESRVQIESERSDALLRMGERYGVDRKHAAHVRLTAEQLFDGLRSLHALPLQYRHWLGAAAVLHEVGGFVNRAGRHRHTYYVIEHSELLGFSPEERRIVATIARFVGKSKPKDADRLIALLPAEHRVAVVRSIALLRVALALNQSRRGVVRALSAKRRAGRMVLKAKHRGSAELELWAAQKEADNFYRVFGLWLDFELV